MSYLFVYVNSIWYLKISTIDELIDYHQKTDSRWQDCCMDYIDGKPNPLVDAVIAMRSSRNQNILEAIPTMVSKLVKGQLSYLQEKGFLLINSRGGYCALEGHTQFVRRAEFIFPDYTEADVRITKWENGRHWYAYIGDMQVRNGDELKWNTYAAARAAVDACLQRAELI